MSKATENDLSFIRRMSKLTFCLLAPIQFLNGSTTCMLPKYSASRKAATLIERYLAKKHVKKRRTTNKAELNWLTTRSRLIRVHSVIETNL